jgi:hypothetical protein
LWRAIDLEQKQPCDSYSLLQPSVLLASCFTSCASLTSIAPYFDLQAWIVCLDTPPSPGTHAQQKTARYLELRVVNRTVDVIDSDHTDRDRAAKLHLHPGSQLQRERIGP